MRGAATFLHILLFGYWLGADVGVYYASRFVVRATEPMPGRIVAVRILHVVDLAPRICLILILPTGVAVAVGSAARGAPTVALVAVWLASGVWLWLMLADYRRRPGRFGDLVHRLDLGVRSALVVGLLGFAAYAFVVGGESRPRWLAGKLAAYALCIAGGLAIRAKLTPFGVAWTELLRNGSSPRVEGDLSRALRGTLPYVFAIWVLVIVAALLGVLKPGAVT